MNKFLLRSGVALSALFWALGATAQGTPSADQMVEQLKAPRTRSLRNLTIEAAPPAGTTAAPNSLPPAAAGTANAAVAATPPQAGPTATAGEASSNAGSAAPVATVVPTATAAPTPPAAPYRPSLSLLIQFDFNSSRVRPESQQALANLAQALQSSELSQSHFAVEGHTDAKGGADYNLRLSQQRAEAVRDYLVSRGVTLDRLMATGKGATDLANAAEPFAAENRRVRIVNLD